MNEDRSEQTTEVRETNERQGNTNVRRESVSTSSRVDGGVIARRVVYYLGGVIIALLALRVVLLMLGANQGSAFVDFVYVVSGFFAAPFHGIFNYQPAYGASIFEVSTLVAIVVYALLTVGIGRLFTLGRPRTDV